MEGRNLAPYHCTFKYGDKTYSFYDLKVVKDSFKAREDLLKLKDDDAKNELLKQHSKKVNAELIKLSKGGPVEIVGIDQPVQITDLSVSPAEVIMPKTVATLFGLTAEDSLDKITENENFFVEKLQKNLKTTALDSNSYTVALKNISGKHVYIMDRDTYNKRKNKFKAEIYPEFTVDPIT